MVRHVQRAPEVLQELEVVRPALRLSDGPKDYRRSNVQRHVSHSQQGQGPALE